MLSKAVSSQNGPAQHTKAHRLILQLGERTIILAFPPGIFIAVLLFILTSTLCFVGCTFYLFNRDGLLERQALQEIQLRKNYEANFERYKTAMLAMQNQTEAQQTRLATQIAELNERQTAYTARHARIVAVLDQARQMGIQLAAVSAPIPASKPAPNSLLSKGELLLEDDKNAIGGNFEHDNAPPSTDRNPMDDRQSYNFKAYDPLQQIEQFQSELDGMQKAHFASLRAIEAAVQSEHKLYREALSNLPLKLALPPEQQATGGPFFPLSYNDQEVNEASERIEAQLQDLARLRKLTKILPIASPLKYAQRSSGFGRRIDPFRGQPAFHTGIDFRAASGTSVFATAPGTVIQAGRQGGYGNIVEVRHARGLITRYAHLSRISVKLGEQVARGQTIGKAGSTGRSTGPHLHYEVRYGARPHDPQPFLDAGKRFSF